jgi:hypothetical protein
MAASYSRHYPDICLDRLRKSRKFLSAYWLLQMNLKKTPTYESDIYCYFFVLFYVKWARTGSDIHRPTVLENIMIRDKFGPKTG